MQHDEQQRALELVVHAISEGQRSTDVSRDSGLRDLGLDSIAVANIIFALADEYRVELESIVDKLDLANLETVGDIQKLARVMLEAACATN